jgi:membrane protein DedA with SNARE-associated domain
VLQQVLGWLSSLPLEALYASMAIAAAIENIFPPIPADSIVAFGAFLAARGKGTLAAAFLATWLGNVAGALITYYAGRRLGAEQMERRLLGTRGAQADSRLQALYGRYGMLSLFISRFLPGVRAIVPPFAGALRIPVVPAMTVIAVASGLWYGAIALLAFRVGGDWARLTGLVTSLGRGTAVAATVLAIAGAAIWLHRRRARR